MKTAATVLTVSGLVIATIIIEAVCIVWHITTTIWDVLVTGKERGL